MNFEMIGENLHCSRLVRLDGKHVRDNQFHYTDENGAAKVLPVTPEFLAFSPAAKQGQLKQVALAIFLIRSGNPAGADFIRSAARRQLAAGAAYLDLNVDEYSSSPAEQEKAMEILVEASLAAGEKVPLSIDSSSPDTLCCGIECAFPSGTPILINSLSLKKPELFDFAANHHCRVIASASGREAMETEVGTRLANLKELWGELVDRGIAGSDILLDPLVFPLSVEPAGGEQFFELVKECRAVFGDDVRFAPGLSNASFGLPLRRLINLAFLRRAIEAGCNGALIDPVSTTPEMAFKLDPADPAVAAAYKVVSGEDFYALDFVSLYHEGAFDGWKI